MIHKLKNFDLNEKDNFLGNISLLCTVPLAPHELRELVDVDVVIPYLPIYLGQLPVWGGACAKYLFDSDNYSEDY